MLDAALASVLVMLAICISYYVSVILHEFGHVLAGKLAGVVPTSFGLGRGRIVFVRSVLGMRFYIGARGSSGGQTYFLIPQLLPGRW
jgi:membrane-associated protease RseP (regulator of RpoE activity)